MAKLTEANQYSIITDHLGTPIQMFDAKGKEHWSMSMDIYGGVQWAFGWTHVQPFRFPGQYHDELRCCLRRLETGLFYSRFCFAVLRARYYDSEMGGLYFSGSDWVGWGNPTLYGYVIDPLNYVDFLGLNPIIVIGEGQSGVNRAARGLSGQGKDVRVITDDWAREFKKFDPYIPAKHEASSIEYNR